MWAVFSTSNHSSLPRRRDFIAAATGAAGLSFARTVFGQSSSAVSVTKLTDSILLMRGESNVLAVLGPDSVMLVDGGAVEHSSDLMES